ncbi:MAG: tRNA pseudouridine(55) synthase TruB [Bacilli bacterium]|nr:tRNA pseudouridine(55) synthase TruB [Bacilli bacterium]
MDGIVLINKEKGITSRDVVNKISKKLNIKKVGHAGTLDPIATGLLVIGIGKGTKILDLLTVDNKEYIAVVKMGIQTDTLDITGTILEELDEFYITKEDIDNTLKKFIGSYEQTIPKYSALKINGKRLYEYARNNEEVELPKRKVTIFDITLLDIDLENKEFKFKVLVSKGTYIRSLIDDIGKMLNIPMTMKDLVRTKCGRFKLEDSNLISDDYNYISLNDSLNFKNIKVIDEIMLKKIKNGNKLILENEDSEFIKFVDKENNLLAIYKKNNFYEFRSFKVF